MASPLHLHGGFQLTQQNPGTSAALRWRRVSPTFISETGYTPPAGYPLHFKRRSPSTALDVVLAQHISMHFGSQSLVLIPEGAEPPTYNATRMFLMFC